MRLPLVFASVLLGFHVLASASELSDSTTVDSDRMKFTSEQSLRVHRTTLWAACVPGAGQIANGKIWKAPIVWGAMGYMTDLLMYNVREFRNSKTYLVAELDDDPLTDNPTSYNAFELEERAVFYRRNRDLAVLGLLGVHLLSILDANVDAHLMDFDVGRELKASLFYQPFSGQAGIRLNW